MGEILMIGETFLQVSIINGQYVVDDCVNNITFRYYDVKRAKNKIEKLMDDYDDKRWQEHAEAEARFNSFCPDQF